MTLPLYLMCPSPSTVTLLVAGLSHVRIDSSTERRERSATTSHRRRTSILGENTTGQTTSCNTVGQVVLRSQTLNTALDACKERANLAEVLGHGERLVAHILEADFELLAEGKVRNRCLAGRHGRSVRGIVGHLGEVSKGATVAHVREGSIQKP